MTISVSFLEKQKQQRVEANDIIKRDTLYAAGLGLVPVPIVDVLSIATIQIWMIRDIAKIYNIPFKRHMVKSFIGSLIGNTGAISLVKFIPGVGSILGGASVALGGATATYALGQLFTEHFYQGGTLLDFDPVKSRAYFQKLYSEHESTVKTLQKEKEESIAASSSKTTVEATKKQNLHFQQQNAAPIVASLRHVRDTALLAKENEQISQEENEHILQLKADKIALTNTIEEVVHAQVQAQHEWGEQEKAYLNSQKTNNQHIVQLEADKIALITKIEEVAQAQAQAQQKWDKQEKIYLNSQVENDQHIGQLETDKIALITRIEEVVQAQQEWSEQEKGYLNTQKADQQEISDLIVANKSQEEEMVTLQQQLKEATGVVEKVTVQYEKSKEQLQNSFVDLQQEVKEKETFKKQLAQYEVREKAQKQQVKILETTTQQQQTNLSALRRELQVKEESQKQNWLWWILLPLLLLAGWFAGLSYGKTTTNTTPTNLPATETIEVIKE